MTAQNKNTIQPTLDVTITRANWWKVSVWPFLFFLFAIYALLCLWANDHTVPIRSNVISCTTRNDMTRAQYNSFAVIPAFGEPYNPDSTYPPSIHYLRFDDRRACRFVEVLISGHDPQYSCICVNDIRALH